MAGHDRMQTNMMLEKELRAEKKLHLDLQVTGSELPHKFQRILFPPVDSVVLGINMVHRHVGKIPIYLK